MKDMPLRIGRAAWAFALLAVLVVSGCGPKAKQTSTGPTKAPGLAEAPAAPAPSASTPAIPARPSLPIAEPAPTTQAPAPAATASAATGKGVAGAKGLMSKLEHMKNINQLPRLMTNDSAATLGMVFGATVVMMAGFAESFGSMQPGMTPGTGATKPKLDPARAAQLAKIKALKGEAEAVFKRYGVNTQASPQAAPPAKLKANGRAFLTEMLTVMEKLPKRPGSHGGGLPVSPKAITAELSKLKYRPISSTRVEVTALSAQGRTQQFEARYEEGAWRLQLPDISKMMGAAGPHPGGMPSGPRIGAPGMGGPGMGMPMPPPGPGGATPGR